MRALKYLLYIILPILIFASCKDENMFMPSDSGSSCSILVSVPDMADTRAVYKDKGDEIAVIWETGDVIKVGSTEFTFLEQNGEYGLFTYKGDIANAEKWTGTISYNTDINQKSIQIQKRNNDCREALSANVTSINLYYKPVVNLLPAANRSLLHIQGVCPGKLMGESLLKIHGLAKEEYTIKLGTDHSQLFADKGEQLDIFVVVPSTLSVNSGTTIKFYLYAYDDDMGNATDGDEYHYYMRCNTKISVTNDNVVKLVWPDRPTHTAIQLGLTSRTKWATTNVGASVETDFGNYYTWGETEIPAGLIHSEGNSKMYNQDLATLQKAGYVDVNGDLTSKYDAAAQNWGEEWKMPSLVDLDELIEGTTSEFVNGGAVNGVVVKSKYINGKSVFFPLAGHIDRTDVKQVGTNGQYWTTTFSSKTQACKCEITKSQYLKRSTVGIRYKGFSIRPILSNISKSSTRGMYTVNDKGKKVKFSNGNLQYQASTGTWRFAEHQYDRIGYGNLNMSSTYTGWIDLFGWGTSGWQSGSVAYMPYSISSNNADYSIGDKSKSLTVDKANADWGVYNAISNGGNRAGLWRVLTSSEADYLLNTRTNSANLKTKATVNGIPGVLLLSDNWEKPDYPALTMNVSNDFVTNNYSEEDWETLEFFGAVFLPAAGYRNASKTPFTVGELGDGQEIKNNINRTTGAYWTSTRENDTRAKVLVFKANGDGGFSQVISVSGDNRWGGSSVRLVRDVE